MNGDASSVKRIQIKENIYSKYFRVESVDRYRKRRVTVEYHNNMRRMGDVKVDDYTGEPYTCVTFRPDYGRFGGEGSGLTGLTDDMFQIMKKRVYDAAAWTDHRVSVTCCGPKGREQYVAGLAGASIVRNRREGRIVMVAV